MENIQSDIDENIDEKVKRYKDNIMNRQSMNKKRLEEQLKEFDSFHLLECVYPC